MLYIDKLGFGLILIQKQYIIDESMAGITHLTDTVDTLFFPFNYTAVF